MRRILNIQKQLLPDMIDILKKRYTILQHIRITKVIGRRTLAAALHITERVLRAEVELLKRQGLIQIDPLGMKVSESGLALLDEMEPIIKELFGLNELATRIQQRFGLSKVIIVPGDSDQSPYAKLELGRAGANVLSENAVNGDVIAVTGGSTMADIADAMTVSTSRLRDCWFVPARGGLGETVELQANTIASTMAKKTGGQYRLLHVPDHLSEEAYVSLMQEPNIQEIIEVIRKARIAIHGIGDAYMMAQRRKVSSDMIQQLKQEGALSEAFGYYFDRDGQVVHKMPTVGLRLEDIKKMELVIAVAGGKSKGEAIAAIMKFGHTDVLVTDEAAANEMLVVRT